MASRAHIEQLENIIGRLEGWQHRVHMAPHHQHTVNTLKHHLIELVDELEDERHLDELEAGE